MRAFEYRRPIAPNGWGSAPELVGAIAAVLRKSKASSTVRETWRLGRDALLKKAYLSRKVFDGKKGPEIRYALRYVDGKVSIPADQYGDLTPEEKELLFPTRKLSPAESLKARQELGDTLMKGFSFVKNAMVSGATTAELEEELIQRLDPNYSEPLGPLYELSSEEEKQEARKLKRAPSPAFLEKLRLELTGSVTPPSTRSGARRTPSRLPASSARPRRERPSRTASKG
jgi:hypothetical protein